MDMAKQNYDQETATSFMPLIPRLDRLDRLLQVIEEKHSFSRSELSHVKDVNGLCDQSDGYKTLSSAMEEVQYKGTLLDRLALLETRVLQLSLDMDEENTSKSSSSTFQVFSETAGKDNTDNVTPQDVQNAASIQAKETAAQEGEYITMITKQHKSKGQKRKSKKRLGLFRFRFIC